MTRFQVDSDAVQAAGSAALSSISRIQSEMAALHGQLLSVQSSWTGQAATLFQGVVTDWWTTEQRVEQTLAALVQALGQAARQYAEIEHLNMQRFTR
ncbi:MAG: hypothetical protein JWP30_911 [Homoserinimonas sp.]|jgi:early secretory antigenic target protein ESAT-6|nr:hypothetical protein [Homoserinimonas sp.]